MTVRDVLRDWLKVNGYAGLAGDECGCSLDDLAPCGGDPLGCQPADLHKCSENCEHQQYCPGDGFDECYRPRPEAGKEPR